MVFQKEWVLFLRGLESHLPLWEGNVAGGALSELFYISQPYNTEYTTTLNTMPQLSTEPVGNYSVIGCHLALGRNLHQNSRFVAGKLGEMTSNNNRRLDDSRHNVNKFRV